MEYATQMDAARKGIVTKEMEIVAKKENIDVESLRQLIAKGQVIIPVPIRIINVLTLTVSEIIKN